MEPSVTLAHVKRITGISRNQLSEIFGYSPSVILRWETDPATIPADARETFDEFLDDFLAASDALDEDGLTWDDVAPARIIAMKLGVSVHTFESMMKRRKRELWDFGTLGLWATDEDLAACRRD
jgi:hypothetical protein